MRAVTETGQAGVDGQQRGTHTALKLLSPCRAEEKEQDSAGTAVDNGACIAVVCDGTTQSLCSAEAAQLIASDPPSLWNGGLPALVRSLVERRDALIANASAVDEPTSFLERAFAKIVSEARERSYQTTFVTARLTPLGDSRVLFEAKACGDSGVLVFDSDGTLRQTNLPTADDATSFGHLSPLTEVLPDHFGADEVLLQQELDRDAHVVLCSDGFYDAFAGPRELFNWLLEHGDSPEGEARAAAMSALHDRLDARVGDDDITVVWLRPSVSAAPEAAATTLPVPEPSFSRGLGRMLRLFFRRFIPRREISS